MSAPLALTPTVDAGWRVLQRAVGALALLLLAQWASPLLVPIAISGVLALVATAPLEWLERRGIPTPLAAAAVLTVPIACVGIAAVALFDAGSSHWLGVDAALADVRSFLEALAAGTGRVSTIAQWLLAQLRLGAGRWVEPIAPALWRYAAESLLTFSSAMVLLFFVLIAQRALRTSWLGAMPNPRARRRSRVALEQCRREVATYVQVVTVINAGLGMATCAALVALGVSNAVVWGVATFLLAFIPYLGPLAVAVLLLLAGSATFGATLTAALPSVAFIALHAVESNLISPWLMGDRLRVSRVAVLIAVMAGAWVWGLIGGVLAVPLLSGLRAALGCSPRFKIAKALLAEEKPVRGQVEREA